MRGRAASICLLISLGLLGGRDAAEAESCCADDPGNPPAIDPAPFPMIPGEGASTCFGGCTADLSTTIDPDTGKPILESDPDGFVLAIVDLYDRAVPAGRRPPAALRGENWCAPMYHNEPSPTQVWSTQNLGHVFGIALDDAEATSIYLTASTIYGDFLFPPTSGGPGAIYRIDGATGDICLYAELPNGSKAGRGPALGDLAYDPVHRQLLVSNFEDGLIYRLEAGPACGAAATLDTYDHGLDGRSARRGRAPIADDPGVRFTPLGRRVWAVAVFEGRLYYSTWEEDQARAAVDRANEIWSVALDGSGAVVAASARPEVVLPMLIDDYSMPVSDISFAPDGRMLLAERSMPGDTGGLHEPAFECSGVGGGLPLHRSRALEYRRVGIDWVPSTDFGIGFAVGQCCTFFDPPHANSAGGIDYDCAGDLWVTGDALIAAPPEDEPPTIYGLQWIDGAGNSPATVVSESWFIDLNGDIGLGDCDDPSFDPRRDKGSIGDIEILDCPCATDRPPIILCTDCELCNDPGLCRAALDCTTLATAVDPDGGPVTLECEPKGPYEVGPPTEIVVTATDGTHLISETCFVSVVDCEPPTCEAPDAITLECNERCGVRGDDPAIRRLLAGASGADNCLDVTLDDIAPPLYGYGCVPGSRTPIGFVVTDGSGHEKTCRSAVVVQDTTPPRLSVPPPLTVECPSPRGLPASDPRVAVWVRAASAVDRCGDAAWTHDGPPSFPASCAPGATTRVTFTAVDDCGNTTVGASTVTVLDTTPPVVTGCDLLYPLAPRCAATAQSPLSPSSPLPPQSPASPGSSPSPMSYGSAFGWLLPLRPAPSLAAASPSSPAPPQSPASPSSPRSASSAGCAGATRATVVVDCGVAVDDCSPRPPEVEATIILVRYDVEASACVRVEEEIPVACGEEMELERLASPCAAGPPRSAGPPLTPASPGSPSSPRSDDRRVLRGEEIHLRVRARDACGNLSEECRLEATSERGPLPVPPPAPDCAGPLCCELVPPPRAPSRPQEGWIFTPR